jgi:hypothetical protein
MTTTTTMTPTTTTLTDLASELLDAGFCRGTPSVEAATIDSEAAAEAVCGTCSHQGLSLHPFVGLSGYRAIAACPACGQAEEF